MQPGDQAGGIGPDGAGYLPGTGDDVRIAVRRRGVLGDVGLRHSVEPVQPVRTVGGDTDQDRHPGDAISQQSGTGQSVRAAARPADDRELLQFTGVRDREHVGRHVGDPAAFQPVRLPVTRPVEGEQPDTQPVQDGRSRVRA